MQGPEIQQVSKGKIPVRFFSWQKDYDKNWYNKALNNTLTDKEREHFMFLLKNGDSMYNKNKLTTKN